MKTTTMITLYLLIIGIGFNCIFYLLFRYLPSCYRKHIKKKRSIKYDKVVFPAFYFHITEKITIPEYHWRLVNILMEERTKEEYIKCPAYFSAYLILKFDKVYKNLVKSNEDHINKLLTKEFNEYKSKNKGNTA